MTNVTPLATGTSIGNGCCSGGAKTNLKLAVTEMGNKTSLIVFRLKECISQIQRGVVESVLTGRLNCD